MIVLDTNVVSEMMKGQPDPLVRQYLDGIDPGSIFITAITVAEIRLGIGILPPGLRKAALESRAEAMFAGLTAARCLPFDWRSAGEYAEVRILRRAFGQPISVLDAMIASICVAHGSTLATRNTKDFVHTNVVLANPWIATNG